MKGQVGRDRGVAVGAFRGTKTVDVSEVFGSRWIVLEGSKAKAKTETKTEAKEKRKVKRKRKRKAGERLEEAQAAGYVSCPS